MEAYADPLKYYEPDQANTTNVPESIQKVKSNDNARAGLVGFWLDFCFFLKRVKSKDFCLFFLK